MGKGATSITGADVLIINGNIITSVADNDYVKIEFPDDLVVVKATKNGNVIYAFKPGGMLGQMEVRILQGSNDDKLLNGFLADYKRDPAGFVLLVGSYTKRVGDGSGKITSKVFQLTGGVVKKQSGMKTSGEGDTEQSVAVYAIEWGQADPSLQ